MQLAHNREWGFHNARVNSVAWSPNSDMVASGSLDTTIIIWSVTNPAKHTIIKSKCIANSLLYKWTAFNKYLRFRRSSSKSNNTLGLAR